MSSLKKPYEISVWRDVPQDNGTFKEQKIAIIGSNIMTSQYRAANPKLTRKINGANEFSFVLYRRYKNSISGKETVNPFVDLINNESKIKLLYDGEWYDFVIKDIQQDTSKHSIAYTATDQHVNELSKNGYNLELADDLMNNSGNLQELATTVLADTDWEVYRWSDWPVQYLEETLIKLNEHKNGVDYTIYAFYSSCRSGAKRFQFIAGDLGLGLPNAEGVYDRCTQYYIDSPVYGATDNLGLALPQPGNYLSNAGEGTYELGKLTYANETVFTDKRANRIVYTHKSVYNPVLNKYVYEYNTAAGLDGQTIMGFSETEYITPNIVENYVTNNTFKSVSGWRGAALTDSENAIEKDDRITKPTCSVDAVRSDGSTTLLDDLKSGVYNGATYEPRLNVKISEAARDDQTCIVTNSGFYDCRTTIGNVKPSEKFVLIYRCAPTGQKEASINPEFTVTVADYRYNTTDDTYHTKVVVGNEIVTKTPLLTFKCGSAIKTITTSDGTSVDYHYVVAIVDSEYNLTEREFKNSKFQIFIETSSDLNFYDFQIFRFVQQENTSGNNNFVSPLDQAVEGKAITKYYYYDPEKNSTDPTSLGYVSAQQDYKWFVEPTTDPLTEEEINKLYPVYTDLRYRSIQISKSNYFNAIQELCEKFECWAEFIVPHDEQGNISQESVKSVRFYTDVGETNYAGFRYGINLKSSKRTMDSKSFVSKLIVPDNVNEAADNGYCTISTAKANPSGENYILNFSYYINQGMMDGEYLHEFLYRPKDPEKTNEDDLQGYYHQLRALNDTITEYSELYSALVAPLSQAEADLQTAEAGYTSAAEKLEDAETTFLLETGCAWDGIEESSTLHKLIFGYTDEGGTTFSGDSKLLGYLTEIAEYKTAAQKYQAEEARAKATYEFYKGLNDTYYKAIQEATAAKDILTKAFYSRYSRFIQEGTWTDSTYIDNDTYYTDALATSYNSCQPQVTYTFDVVDLSALDGYESLIFRLGDLTWVEDPELFGNARESVVITELTYSLDAPDKNTIKVQNYRNQFADLFQKMIATTQTVQYSSAAWERAGNFTGSNAIDQAAFLQDALESAELVLKNSGEQSVVWDKTGITVTDNDSPNKQIRIVGGAIMLRDEDGDGLGWKVGITSSGINAKLITAGQVDTGVIRIMNGNDNLFRWDKSGINAYDYTSSEGYNSVSTKRGVRFDKFGIYGYDLSGSNKEPESWTPNDIDEIKANGVFSLTWEGLFINAATGKYYATSTEQKPSYSRSSVTVLGKTDGLIYNDMNDGNPIYNTEIPDTTPEFTKIMSVGGTLSDDGRIFDEKFALYDNGAIVLKEVYLSGVHWAKDSSPSKTVYAVSNIAKPADGTKYADFADSSETNWHKEQSANDHYYSHTDDDGATWSLTTLLTGKSITKVETYYYCGEAGQDPKSISDWVLDYVSPEKGQCQYTKTVTIYNDGSTTISYSVAASGSDGQSGNDGIHGAEQSRINLYQATNANDVAAPGITDFGYWTEDYETERLSFGKNNIYFWACPITKTTAYDSNNNSTTTYSDVGEPYLLEAFFGSDDTSPISTISYAEFLNLTNFGNAQGLSYNSDGNLYINASYINTGTLTVTRRKKGTDNYDKDDVLFAAGWNDDGAPNLELGGFKVAPEGIDLVHDTITGEKIDAAVMYTNLNASSLGRYSLIDTSFILAPNGIKAYGSSFDNKLAVSEDGKNFSLILGKTFGVTTDGILYATGANISGTITAGAGNIGNWDITEDGIVYTMPNGNETRISSSGRIITDYISATTGSFTSLTISNLITRKTLTANKIKIGSIPLYETVFSTSSSSTSVQTRTVTYEVSTNKDTSAITIEATLSDTNGSTDSLFCGGEVSVVYPGLTTNDETLWMAFTIEVPAGKKTGSTVVYGYYKGSAAGGDLRNIQEEVSYSVVSSDTAINPVIGIKGGIAFQAEYDGDNLNMGTIIPYHSGGGTGGIKTTGQWVFEGSATSFAGFTTFKGTTKFTGEVLNKDGSLQFTSDRRLKIAIATLADSHDEFFDLLRPVSFSYRTNPGTHFGFIAQDVLDACAAASIDSSKIVGTFIEDNTEYYSLSYTDIIALNTSQIQKLKCRIAELEAKVEELSRKFD